MSYEIVFTRSARKELEKIDHKIAEQILRKIEKLISDPRPAGCRKLKGEQNLWRIRVGSYRIVYSILESEKLIDISVVRHRKDVYK